MSLDAMLTCLIFFVAVIFPNALSPVSVRLLFLGRRA